MKICSNISFLLLFIFAFVISGYSQFSNRVNYNLQAHSTFPSHRYEKSKLWSNAFASTSVPPKIILGYSYESNADGKGSTRKIVFSVDNREFNYRGFCSRKLKPYIAVDHEALLYLQKSQRQGFGSGFFVLVVCSVFADYLYQFNIDPEQSFMPLGITIGGAFIGSVILSHTSTKNLKKSVASYNKTRDMNLIADYLKKRKEIDKIKHLFFLKITKIGFQFT